MTDVPLAAAMEAQGRALRALARSILRGSDDAEDIVQDACLAALARSPSPHNAGGWLAAVVRNFARRRLRDRARRERLDASVADSGPATAPAADELPAELEVHRRLADAVRGLREPMRRAIVMRYWHDLSPRLISRRLDMPVATVKTHLQRGLAELRTALLREQPERRAWLAALAAVSHPHLMTGAAAGAPFATVAATTFAIMKLQHALFLAVACVCVGLMVWQPWDASAMPPQVTPPAGDPSLVQAAVPAGKGSEAGAAATTPDAANQRVVAPSTERICTVVGRIATTGDQPIRGARIRLVPLWENAAAPPVAADAAADGTFAFPVPRLLDWIPYGFALADAPGWAVRELQLGQDVQRSIADDRLDLGTFRLERGVDVAGRIVEADGTPLRTRARLLAWDPGRSGSWTAMFGGRTVGFAEPGGQFHLADRLSATAAGAWMLAAVSASGVGWAELAFAAGQDRLDPVEIWLLSGGAVEVRVVDLDGKPVEGASVHATPHFKPIGLAPMWESSRISGGLPALAEVQALLVRTADAAGQARFDHLPRRQDQRVLDANRDQRACPAIIMSAEKTGYVTNGAEVDPGKDTPTQVTITLGKQRTVAFHGVVRTPDGQPRPGVEVRQNGGDLSGVTDGQGRYELPATTYQGDQAHFLLEGGGVPQTFALADIPAVGDRVEHDFTVEVRAPAHGRVVDQYGKAVAGVELLLGLPRGTHYPSTPARTGEDGAFAFPDAVASHTDLWVQPPEPRAAWRIEPARALTRRDGEIVTLHRLDGPLIDLTLTVVDGRTGAPVSPTEVQLHRLYGSSRDLTGPHVQATLSLGAATALQLRPGSYRATVRAPGDLTAVIPFTLPPDAPKHGERIELWPAVALVCTVDTSALPPADLAARSGKTLLLLLDAQSERSYAVDAAGKRLPLTVNTGAIRFGGDTSFRLERVTPNVPLRVRALDNELSGEAWFRAEPGAEVHVTLRLVSAGRLTFAAPAAWPPGTIEVDVRIDGVWQPARSWQRRLDPVDGAEPSVARPAGETEWRITLWPANGDAPIERTGTSTVVAGRTVPAKLD